MHWTYENPDRDELLQGDVLVRTPDLISLLKEVHPYLTDDKYVAYLVLTQSCDLVRRKQGGPCKAAYISVAGVRSFGDVVEKVLANLARERGVTLLGEGTICPDGLRNALSDSLRQIVNNNHAGYLFLRADPGAGIPDDQCAVLRVNFPLRAEHYGLLLEAKRVQLASVFQAKLGWLLGDIFARVGTPDWEESDERSAAASQLLKPFIKVYTWLPEKRLDLIVGALHKQNKPDSRDNVFALLRSPETKLPTRKDRFQNAFDESWPSNDPLPQRDHVLTTVPRTLGDTLDNIWPEDGEPTLDRAEFVEMIVQAVSTRMEKAWPKPDKPPPSRKQLLARLSSNPEFKRAMRDD